MPYLTDEHVPRVFITTLRSAGHDVVAAKTVMEEGTDDEQLLRFCADDNRVLITHDKKHFSGPLIETVDHPGVVIYTDANHLRDNPASAVRTLERISTRFLPENGEIRSSGSTSGGDGVRVHSYATIRT